MGAARKILASGETMVVTHLDYEKGDDTEAHAHSHEQCGYVVSGKFRLTLNGKSNEIALGGGYVVPAGVTHTFEVIEPGAVLIIASPAQETTVGA